MSSVLIFLEIKNREISRISLEAMAAAGRVLAGISSSIPEICRDAPFYFERQIKRPSLVPCCMR